MLRFFPVSSAVLTLGVLAWNLVLVMKLIVKNLPVLTRLIILGMVIGTLAWELLDRLLLNVGVEIDLSVGPVGFDITVVSLFVMVNPGTLAGLIPAILIFRKS